MSVSASLTLPAQPAVGVSRFTPLGGDGTSAPLGCYLTTLSVVGDASAGTATVILALDARFTNLIAFIDATVASAAAAPDFHLAINDGVQNPSVIVTGTMPHTAIETTNASFLWYPPPLYWIQNGRCTGTYVNVDATETYSITLQVYVFHPEVTRITPLPFLQWNVPGVSAPAAI